MLRFSGKRKKAREEIGSVEVGKLSELLSSAGTTAACLAVLKQENLLGASGIDSSLYDLLQKAGVILRDRGLGLEPNLLGRVVASAILDRRLAGEASMVFGATDTDVRVYIAEADAARDRKEFADAEYHYWRALQLFPSHPGYLVQYGHCLKERSLNADALVAYLDAHYSGAPKQDVAPHALHVAGAIGKYDKVDKILRGEFQDGSGEAADLPMASALTSRDVRTLIQLFHLRAPSIEEVAHRMCDYPSRRALALALLKEAEFPRAHRDLLRMLAETGVGQK